MARNSITSGLHGSNFSHEQPTERQPERYLYLLLLFVAITYICRIYETFLLQILINLQVGQFMLSY